MEQNSVEKFFGHVYSNLKDGSEYPLFLMYIGERNSAVVMNTSAEQIKVLKKFCKKFDFHYKVSEGRVSKPSKTIMDKQKLKQKGVFISKEQDRFEILQKGRFYGFTDTSVGKFLEFPEKSVEFFSNEEQPVMKYKEDIKNERQRNI